MHPQMPSFPSLERYSPGHFSYRPQTPQRSLQRGLAGTHATPSPNCAHSGPQGGTARLHLHLGSLYLLLAELLGKLAEAHAGLLLTVFLHLPQQNILLGCVEPVAPGFL